MNKKKIREDKGQLFSELENICLRIKKKNGSIEGKPIEVS